MEHYSKSNELLIVIIIRDQTPPLLWFLSNCKG
jgi:hypothetical protein